MANRLATAVSPYLVSHAENPVDWYPWGPDAFAEAARRDVPVLISIGYSTCHWCHVMARESFSDPALAHYLNDHFVSIKVDREEHPDVDAAYLAAAGVFTPDLGWPLNVFATPTGRTFHAGTYSPPRPVAGHASFRQVLEAVTDAWQSRRGDVEESAAGLADALAQAASAAPDRWSLDDAAFAGVLNELLQYEDTQYGGFGGSPKFPVAPTLLFLAALSKTDGFEDARGVVERALRGMTTGGLLDPVEGGFFRYATRRDWSVPHYERMLTDNALLLQLAAGLGDRGIAAGIVRFLRDVLQQPGGGFGSAQDSESVVDGERSEGGYYALDAAGRERQLAPAVDRKVLTGWNGLAIRALAAAATTFDEPDWLALAERTADALLARHRTPDGLLVRASLGTRVSDASAALDDYGAFADGLLEVALAAGRADLAIAARELIDACLHGDDLRAPGGGDPVLSAFGILEQPIDTDGATPSGSAAAAAAAWRLYLLTADERYAAASGRAIGARASAAVAQPLGFGATLDVALAQSGPLVQLVVVAEAGGVALTRAVQHIRTSITAVVTPAAARDFATAGFELFADRDLVDGIATAYLCRDFVCRLPITDAAALLAAAR